MSVEEIREQMPSPQQDSIPQENSKYTANAKLIAEAQAGSERAMEELVVLNMGLVRSLAIRFRDRGTEMEDLIQIGTIGMIKAIRSFDSSRGTTFSTYAVPLIVGEIRRHLRDDGMIRVSRTYRRIGVALMHRGAGRPLRCVARGGGHRARCHRPRFLAFRDGLR